MDGVPGTTGGDAATPGTGFNRAIGGGEVEGMEIASTGTADDQIVRLIES